MGTTQGVFKLRCPDCTEVFRWPINQKWPDYCPHCSAAVSKGVTEIAAPFIKSAKTKANDALYRQIEDASIARAEQAASILNVPVSDVSDLKITNMKDDMREGDIAHIPVQNDITKLMDHQNYAQIQQQGMAYAAQTRVGPEVGHGVETQSIVRREHQRTLTGQLWADTPGGGRRGLD